MKRPSAIVGLGVCLGLSLAAGAAGAFPVEVIQQSGPVSKRFNLVIVGDGYRSVDQAQLTLDARTLVAALFSEAPHRAYQALFNIKLIKAVSNQQGADNGTYGVARDTAFDGYFNCSNIDRLLCVNAGKVLAAAAADVPEFNRVLVIVNDPKYGGAGGNVPVLSIHASASEILRHELGHNLGRLADEYDNPYPGYPACSSSHDCAEPNATLRSSRAQVKWQAWIPAATSVPTAEGTGYSGVGLFEGARYLTSGLYRPVDDNCKMRFLNRPFCPVCTEALVLAFWNLPNIELIEDHSPTGRVAAVAPCADAQFAVATPPVAAPLSYTWSVDGAPQPELTSSFKVSTASLPAGPHTIQVTVRDPTSLVRADPAGLLSQQQSWTLTAVACLDDSAPDAALEGGFGASDGGDSSDDPDAPSTAIDAALPPDGSAPDSALPPDAGSEEHQPAESVPVAAGGAVGAGDLAGMGTARAGGPVAYGNPAVGSGCQMVPGSAPPGLEILGLVVICALIRPRKRQPLA